MSINTIIRSTLHACQPHMAKLIAMVLSCVSLLAYADQQWPEKTRPGQLLAVQDFSGPTALQEAGKQVRIAYVSTSYNGTLNIVNGIVSLPKTPPPQGGYPVISYASGTTGFAPQCAPSSAVNPIRDAYLNEWLKQGFVVLQTDYEGWGGFGTTRPGLHGASNANSMTDIVTAAHAYSNQLSKDWIALGHSQGGGAVLWTAGLYDQADGQYPLKGAVALAPVGPGILKFMNNAVQGGEVHAPPFISMTILGAKAVDPSINLDALVKAPMQPQLALAKTECLPPLFALEKLPAGDYLNPGADFDKVVDFLKTYQDASTLTMKVPVIVLQGTDDESTVTPATTSQMVASLCERGASIEYREYPGEKHRTVIPASQNEVFAFVKAVLANEKRTGECGSPGLKKAG